MAYQQILGSGPFFPNIKLYSLSAPGPSFTSALIDATGEMVSFWGRVWFAGRTGTKNISRVGFRFGTIVKAGGSALTVSLQDVDLVNGPPGQPDGTQDQTVAIANADILFASNTWYRTNTFSASRTVTYGDRLAVVIEYDGAGRLGADSVNISYLTGSGATNSALDCGTSLKTGGTWAIVGANVPDILLEFDDGTFGTLDGGNPVKAINPHTFKSDTAVADEYAATIQFPFPCKVDGLWALVNPSASTATFEILLYSGTTVLATVAIDHANAIYSAATHMLFVPITEQTLAANTTYRVAIRPTATVNVSAFSFDVADANHWTCHDGGIVCTFDTRLDQGAWIGAVATRRLLAGVRISSLDDGIGAGTADYKIQINDGMVIP